MFTKCYLRNWPYLFAVLTLQSVESLTSIYAECSKNITLPCYAIGHSNSYRAVTWYKINVTRIGILRKSSQEVKSYNFPRVSMLGDREALILPSVGPEDSGTYECLLSANVGGKNKESRVFLNVSECITSTPAVFTTPRVTGGYLVSTCTPCADQVVDITTVWIISGFSVVAIVKIALCFLFILVCVMARKREEKRRQHWT